MKSNGACGWWLVVGRTSPDRKSSTPVAMFKASSYRQGTESCGVCKVMVEVSEGPKANKLEIIVSWRTSLVTCAGAAKAVGS